MSDEEHRQQIEEMIGELGVDSEGFSGEDLETIFQGQQDFDKSQNAVEEPEEPEEPETTQETDEDKAPKKARLADNIRAQIDLANQPDPKEVPDPAEELGEFDLDRWAALVKDDPVEAFKMVGEHQLGMKDPGTKIRELIGRFEASEQARRISVAEDFLEANPDYPADDDAVNDFMESALERLKLPYTKRNLQKVWAKAKDEGYIVGFEPEGEEPKSETPPKQRTRQPKKSAEPARRKPIPKAKGRGTTGPISSVDDFNKRLQSMIENSESADEAIEKLRKAGLMEEGSLSRLTGAFAE